MAPIDYWVFSYIFAAIISLIIIISIARLSETLGTWLDFFFILSLGRRLLWFRLLYFHRPHDVKYGGELLVI